jgi:hypothetical protein
MRTGARRGPRGEGGGLATKKAMTSIEKHDQKTEENCMLDCPSNNNPVSTYVR